MKFDMSQVNDASDRLQNQLSRLKKLFVTYITNDTAQNDTKSDVCRRENRKRNIGYKLPLESYDL